MEAKKRSHICQTLAAIGLGIVGISNLVSPASAGSLWNENTQGDLSNYGTKMLDPSGIGPTQLPNLMPGDNFLKIFLDNPDVPPAILPEDRDLDYFIITVPEGLILSKLILSQYGGGTSDDVAFMAIQQGTEFTEPPQPRSIYDPAGSGITNPAKLLGYALVGNKTKYGINPNCNNVNGQNLNDTPLPPGAVVQVGEDLLPIMGNNTNNRPDKIQPNNCRTFGPPSVFTPPLTPPLTAGNYVFWVQQTAPGDTQFTLNFVAATVPEPTSTISLFALGTLGVASTLKRKLKPSKSVRAELID